ncbi:MAG: hypothetical protein ACQCXQ_07775 [Verrucomicrobiales bacterium]|nr:hypothetical protein [Verrucomicrobiota bacterium JB025]
MSLHAELTEESRARLHAQQRNSTISSIIIAVLVIVLIALILGWIFIKPLIKETPTIVTYQSNVVEEEQVDQKRVKTSTQKKPASPASQMAKTIVANTASPTSIPVPTVDVSTPTMDFGSSDDFGSSWGEVAETGFGNIPATMKKRCSKADRLARLQETGGTPQCEDAVVKALNFLKSTQKSNGSWAGGYSPSKPTAMTGLALLAYLGHCETPTSKDYGDTVLRAITYLVDVGMKNNGRLTLNPTESHWPYEHAIATYALGEAATFCKQGNINVPNLFEVTQKAGQIIIDNQHRKTGGWDYLYDTEGKRGGDLSVAAWQIQALKACYHTGLEYKGLTRAANRGIDYTMSMHCDDGGFAYAKANEKSHGDGYRTMTGGGVLCLQMWNKSSSSQARQGLKYIEKNSKFDYDTKYSDLYGHYYEAQAAINRGGETWRKYNAMVRDEILQAQLPDGSWPPPSSKDKDQRAVAGALQKNSNPHYRTCLLTLTLEVYYRFLPGTGVHAK